MAHTDVVFPDTRELPLTVENGRICCPGVGDDTACLVCLLMAAKYIAAHVGKPEWDALRGQGKPGLVLVCNAGEEGLGNLKGVRKICETYGTRMESFCTFDSSLDKIVNQAVGSKRFKVTVSTRGGHSFSDFGQDSAIAKLAGIVVRLYEIQVPEGPRTTYNVGLISGGTSVNTIAQQAEVLYEVRSESRESLELMEGRFTSIIEQARAEGLDVSVEVIGVRPCGGDVDPDKDRQGHGGGAPGHGQYAQARFRLHGLQHSPFPGHSQRMRGMLSRGGRPHKERVCGDRFPEAGLPGGFWYDPWVRWGRHFLPLTVPCAREIRTVVYQS